MPAGSFDATVDSSPEVIAGSGDRRAMLVIDGAAEACLAALLVGGQVLERRDAGQGAATARLPGLVAWLFGQAALRPEELAGIAVTVGPGSFTGLRATIAFAQGLAYASGVALLPVTVGEALRAGLDGTDAAEGRLVWIGIDSRRGRIFLDRAGAIDVVLPPSVPQPSAPLALAGDAAEALASLLASQGYDVLLTEARRPTAMGIAEAARRRLSGALPPLEAVPLYVDPPLASLPAGGLRPAPV